MRIAVGILVLVGWLGAAPAVARAAPALALPAPGRLLLEAAPFGVAVLDEQGRVVRLGEWYESAWSPDGSLIAGAPRGAPGVLRDDGTIVWIGRRATPPVQPDWAPDGRRIAYKRESAVRVVGADGRGDRAVGRGAGFAGPRWQPSPALAARLAWADRRGRVMVAAVDAGRVVWRSRPGLPVRPDGLHWSPDGRLLAAVSGSVVRLFDGATGRLERRVPAGRVAGRFQLGAFAAAGLALARHDFARGRTRVTLLPAPSARERVLFDGRGSVTDLTPSPDGRWLLVGRRSADEWRFLPLIAGARPALRRGITRRVNPQAGGRWAFPRVTGWCC
jgi:hypothetical protein